MGGVIITLDENEAGKRFIELGMREFAEKMDPYIKLAERHSGRH